MVSPLRPHRALGSHKRARFSRFLSPRCLRRMLWAAEAGPGARWKPSFRNSGLWLVLMRSQIRGRWRLYGPGSPLGASSVRSSAALIDASRSYSAAFRVILK